MSLGSFYIADYTALFRVGGSEHFYLTWLNISSSKVTENDTLAYFNLNGIQPIGENFQGKSFSYKLNH